MLWSSHQAMLPGHSCSINDSLEEWGPGASCSAILLTSLKSVLEITPSFVHCTSFVILFFCKRCWAFCKLLCYKEIRTHSTYPSREGFNPGIRWLKIIAFFNPLPEWPGVRWPQLDDWVLKGIFIVEMTSILLPPLLLLLSGNGVSAGGRAGGRVLRYLERKNFQRLTWEDEWFLCVELHPGFAESHFPSPSAGRGAAGDPIERETEPGSRASAPGGAGSRLALGWLQSNSPSCGGHTAPGEPPAMRARCPACKSSKSENSLV